MNETEKILQDMTLSDFEHTVPAVARMTIEEGRKACDFIGLNLEHFPYLDNQFEQKLRKLYKAHGDQQVDREHLWNGGVIPSTPLDTTPSTTGQITVWQRSFFGKYLGPGVFFFGLGCATELLLDGNDGKMASIRQTIQLVGENSARDYCDALSSLMGVAVYIGLARAGVVRPEVAEDMLRQVDSDSSGGGCFSQHVNAIAYKLLETEGIKGALTKEGLDLFLKNTLKTLQKRLLKIAQEASSESHSVVEFDEDIFNAAIAQLEARMGGLSKREKEQIKESLKQKLRGELD